MFRLCTPNVSIVYVFTRDNVIPRLFYVAIEDILVGEDIVVDYFPDVTHVATLEELDPSSIIIRSRPVKFIVITTIISSHFVEFTMNQYGCDNGTPYRLVTSLTKHLCQCKNSYRFLKLVFILVIACPDILSGFVKCLYHGQIIQYKGSHLIIYCVVRLQLKRSTCKTTRDVP
uniref:SET domain-containing protein n=1 Tax=Heterorhabditis bacteriophora TaxID=37862 RepID=A0A1I7WT66_HETBA